MIGLEADLKRHLRDGVPKRVYLLYGEEPYLTAHYTEQLMKLAVGDDAFDEFNLQKFDGQTAGVSEVAAAVETLPLMADRKCVVVRDADFSKMDEATAEAWLSVIADVPECCVLILSYTAVTVEDGGKPAASKGKKGRKPGGWKGLIAAADGAGMVVSFPKPTQTECIRLLMSGAKKRGCEMSDRAAACLTERCGADLYRLVNELDKLCALADGGAVTEEMVTASTVQTLEARVFDLSKMIWQGQAAQAFAMLRTLQADKEKAVSVLSVLSMAYADRYRAKVAQTAGQQAESLTGVFAYGNRSFVLRYAARDVANMSMAALSESLECLARADTEMKSVSIDSWGILDRTVTRLMELRRK